MATATVSSTSGSETRIVSQSRKDSGTHIVSSSISCGSLLIPIGVCLSAEYPLGLIMSGTFRTLHA